MTYCVAWKTETSAFLIADSAVTGNPSHSDNVLGRHTSFGELQGAVGPRGEHTYEKAYKIYTHEKSAVGLAGDAKFGNDFICLIIDNLKCGRTPKEALTLSAQNYIDVHSRPHIKVVIIHHSSEPEIYTFDNKRNPPIKLEDEFVSFGSPPQDLKKYTDSFFSGFKISWERENKSYQADEIFLLRMLALLQAYGIHNYTVESGIGGAYTGVSVSSDGLKLQPDICYVLSGENVAFDTQRIISVTVKNDHFCIVNSESETYVIPNASVDYQQNEARLLKSGKDSEAQFDTGKFKYYIFINTSRHSASVIHMNYNLNHEILSIDIQESAPGTIGLIVSESLNRLNNDNYATVDTPKYAQITYTPYIPISTEQLQLINTELESLRVSKIYGENLDTYKFTIYENGKLRDWYYGNENSAMPFINHFQNSELIRIVNCISDTVEIEYANHKIIFPEIEIDMIELLGKIIKKTKPENIYLFEITIFSDFEPPKQQEINVLSTSQDIAQAEAYAQATSKYEHFAHLTFCGVRFYHQAYMF